MRSRSASAAALYQSCRVAIPESLPIASRSLVRIALLISASASSSTGWPSAGKFAGNDGSDKLGIPQLSLVDDTRLVPRSKPAAGLVCAMHAWFLCKDRADFVGIGARR